MSLIPIFIVFALFFVAVSTADDIISPTAVPTPDPTCSSRIIREGEICQCHLIRIKLIWVFKRVLREAWIESCRVKFGAFDGWEKACNGLTMTPDFQKEKAIAAVKKIVNTCPGALCDFFVI